MKTFFTLLLAALCAATSYGQTMKALSYNASNGVVAYSGTNTLNFPNAFTVAGEVSVTTSGISGFGGTLSFEEALFNANGGDSDWALGGSGFTEAGVIVFLNTTNAAITRTNLGLGATWLTNGNVTNFRSAIGLGTTNTVTFSNVVILGSVSTTNVISTATNFNVGGTLNVTNKAETRTNLGLGAAWLTNANVTNFRTAIGLGENDEPKFHNISVTETLGTNEEITFTGDGIGFPNEGAKINYRNSLGIPLPALTNTSNVTVMRALAGSTNTNQPYSGTIEYLDHGNFTWVMVVSNGIIIDNYEQ
jgi:hypothetical protein